MVLRPNDGLGYWAPVAFESCALERRILLCQENPTYRYLAWVLGIGRASQQQHVVLRHRNTFVGGKCVPSSLDLVFRQTETGWKFAFCTLLHLLNTHIYYESFIR